MKVAIDTGPLEAGHAIRGIGVYTDQLVKAIHKFGDRSLDVIALDFSDQNLDRFDLVHYTTFHPYFLTVPANLEAKVIITIHDLIQLIYPDVYVPGIKGRLNLRKNKSRLRRVDAILAVSQTTKKDIVRYLGVDQEMVRVVYEAPKNIYYPTEDQTKLQEIKKKYRLPNRFVLYVGDVNYNKNLSTLIRATKKAKIKAIICGKQAGSLQDLIDDISILSGPRDYLRYLRGKTHPELVHYQELRELLKQDHVETLGFVPDQDLKFIYNLADVYVQPSLYEGFGLPVLEAMSCGTPVIVGKTNALVEVAGDAVLIVEPTDVKEMSSAIKKVIYDQDLRKVLSEKSIDQVKQFSWEKTARETIQLYKQILNVE